MRKKYLFSKEEFEKHLSTVSYGRSYDLNTVLPSTNTEAIKKAMLGAGDGFTEIAISQSAGEGRCGRRFYSPEGGLYMSVVVKRTLPSDAVHRLTCCAAVAVSEAIEKICGTETGIKWVNDIYSHGKKICGILTQARFNGDFPEFAVIGIGVNVNGALMPPDIAETASSIEMISGKKTDISVLCAEVLNTLEKYISACDTSEYMSEYRRRSLLDGREVTVYSAADDKENRKGYRAKVIGIAENGSLLVSFDGKVMALSSGEVSLELD